MTSSKYEKPKLADINNQIWIGVSYPTKVIIYNSTDGKLVGEISPENIPDMNSLVQAQNKDIFIGSSTGVHVMRGNESFQLISRKYSFKRHKCQDVYAYASGIYVLDGNYGKILQYTCKLREQNLTQSWVHKRNVTLVNFKLHSNENLLIVQQARNLNLNFLIWASSDGAIHVYNSQGHLLNHFKLSPNGKMLTSMCAVDIMGNILVSQTWSDSSDVLMLIDVHSGKWNNVPFLMEKARIVYNLKIGSTANVWVVHYTPDFKYNITRLNKIV